MGKATIGQAEAAIAGMPGLSDQQRQAHNAEVAEARAQALAAGQRAAEQITNDVKARRDELLRDLCQVRDDLAAAKTSGDRSAMADARTRHKSLTAEVDEIERLAEQVEQIEADPTAYGESLIEKYPGIRPDFTFL